MKSKTLLNLIGLAAVALVAGGALADELPGEYTATSNFKMGALCGGSKYGGKIGSSNWADRELWEGDHVTVDTRFPGETDGNNTYAFVPVTGTGALKPVVMGDLPEKHIASVTVWTDQDMFDTFTPKGVSSTKWEDDGDAWYYESSQNCYWWEKSIWPNKKVVADRRWIVVALKQNPDGWWAGAKTLRVGIAGTSVISDPFTVRPDTVVLNPDVSNFTHGMTVSGVECFAPMDDVKEIVWWPYGPDYDYTNAIPQCEFNNPAQLAGGKAVSFSINVPSAGTLVVAGEDDDEDSLAMKSAFTVSGNNIQEDRDVRMSDDQNHEDFLWNLDNYFKTTFSRWVRRIRVSGATTLTFTRTDKDDSDAEFNRIYFFPANKKSVAIEASFAMPDANWSRRMTMHGYVTGSGVYTVGETVTLTAIPGEGEAFDHWEEAWGGRSGLTDENMYSPTLSFTVTEDMCGEEMEESQIVVFAVWKPKYNVAALPSIVGAGTVSGTGSYLAGESATLSATPAQGYDFVKWSDGETAPTRSLGVSAEDRTVYACFARNGELADDEYTVHGKVYSTNDIVYFGYLGDKDSVASDEDYLGDFLYTYSESGEQRADVRTPWGTYELRNVVSSSGNIESQTGLFRCTMSSADGSKLYLEFDLAAKWNNDEGVTKNTYFYEASTRTKYLLCSGQRNRFGEGGSAYDLLEGSIGTYYLAIDYSKDEPEWEGHEFYPVSLPEEAVLTVEVHESGVAKVFGNVDGMAISADGFCTCSGGGNGPARLWIDFVQVLESGKVAYLEGSFSTTGHGLNSVSLNVRQASVVSNSYGPFIAGVKVEFDVGLTGYTAKGLPTGLKYDAKKGVVSGAAKTPGEYEVTFSKKGEEDFVAMFIVRAEEVSVGCEGLSLGTFTAGVAGGAAGIPFEIETETGIKSVAVSKLPAGMKYDAKTGLITGGATKAGDYAVTVTVTTMSGAKQVVTIPVTVAAAADGAVGTFNGFVKAADGVENIGTFQLTTTDAGKLTAKLTTAAGSYSFGGTCWDTMVDGIYSAALVTKKGEKLTLSLNSTAGWDANQLMGTFSVGGVSRDVVARKNAFGKTWYFNAVGNETGGWSLSYAENAKAAALTVTLNADGSTKIAGKLGTLSVSASGYADVTGLAGGVIFADFAPVVSIKDGKSTFKRALSIRANLWFDRSNNHPEGTGTAKVVE